MFQLAHANEGLKEELTRLCEKVIAHFKFATQEFYSVTDEMVTTVRKEDELIDEKEILIEEECLKILALYQPVAKDLRFIVSVIKMNNELERIGDHAVRIIQHIKNSSFKSEKDLLSLPEMRDKVTVILEKSIQAFLNKDLEAAKVAIEMDQDIDRFKHQMKEDCLTQMKNDPEHMSDFLNEVLISRHLERVAELATNIAEDAVYLMKGRIVRHRNYFRF